MRRSITLVLMLSLLFALLSIPAGASLEKLIFGDINNDRVVDPADALFVLQDTVDLIALEGDQLIAADVNDDQQINATDALNILQVTVSLISALPVKEGKSMEKIAVDPVGLQKGTIYLIDAESCFVGQDGRDYDLTRLAVCIQGLVNRNFESHGVAVALNLDSTDPFWLDYIQQEGRTYAGMTRVELRSTEEFLDAFELFMKQYGIIIWDPEVPSTSNVASTICGLERCLPVQYSEAEGSLYQILTKERSIPVKMDLVGKFRGAALGQKIAGTNIDSTGSAKNDAYLWAMDEYMDYCNSELLAYTLDGAPSVPTNPLYHWSNASTAALCGIPNHDYFIAKQCFFFDLTSYGMETPNDDPDQPLGTDKSTLHKILQKRYDMAGGAFGTVIGFPPWHVKYTSFCNTEDKTNAMDAPRLEWQFVETTTSFNCGIEADAAHPCWMSNGSLYTNYECVVEPTPNAPAKKVTYDPTVLYYTFPYAGDYDCSPWLKERAKKIWTDKNLGDIPYTFSLNVNLVDRLPMAFDLMYENRTENDYILAAEGMGYVTPSALFEGFTGREQDPYTRTLPSGDQAYLKYGKPYFERFHIEATTRIINGFTPMGTDAMEVYNLLSPLGNFLQNSTAGQYDLQLYKGTPYLRMFGISGNTIAERCESMLDTQMSHLDNFIAFEFSDLGTNFATATGVKQMVEKYEEYVAENNPDVQVQYVDVNTFLDLVRQSGLGVDVTP